MARTPSLLPRVVFLAVLQSACQRERPAAAVPGADSARAAVERLEERLRLGMLAADTTRLAALWAREYLSTSAVGHTSTRDEALVAFGSGLVRVDTAALRELDVRTYDNAAVSLGFMDWSGSAAGGPFRGTVRFQHVWVNRDGAWRLVASQLTNQPSGGLGPPPR
jgi:hypothetical protein